MGNSGILDRFIWFDDKDGDKAEPVGVPADLMPDVDSRIGLGKTC